MRATRLPGTALLALLPLLAAFHGAAGPRAAELNFGPGDGPYLQGFAPTWEVGEDGVALHWSRRAARVTLPLEATGPVEVVYRFSPPPGGGRVLFSVAGHVDRFEALAERWEERRLFVSAAPRTPLEGLLQVEGKDPRDLGLRLDYVRFELGPTGRLWLRGAARFRPAATVALVALLLAGAGLGLRSTLLASGSLALLAAFGLHADPWLTHRLLTGVPEALVLCGAPGLALGLVLVARERLSREDLCAMVALFAVALLVRLVPLNHPAFFHPDLRTHARIAAHVRHLGWSFLRNPYEGLWRTAGQEGRVASGMWIKSIGGAAVGLPYAVAFHSAVAPFDLDEDAAVTAIRVAGGVAAALAPVLVFLLARALLLSTVGAWLCVVVPSLSAELANAAVPATFGHLLDLTFLIWLARTLARQPAPGGAPARDSPGRGAAILAVCYLGYTSSLVVLTLLVAALLVASATRGPGGRGLALRLGGVLALGAAAAVVVYYWSFVPAAAHSLAAVLAGGGGEVRGSEGLTTFGSVWPALVAWAAPLGGLLAAFGFVRVLRARGSASAVARLFGAAACALAVVALARWWAPQVFGWVHDALFAGPFVCLAIGAALPAPDERRASGRAIRAAVVGVMALGGLLQYGRLLAAQMGSAL